MSQNMKLRTRDYDDSIKNEIECYDEIIATVKWYDNWQCKWQPTTVGSLPMCGRITGGWKIFRFQKSQLNATPMRKQAHGYQNNSKWFVIAYKNFKTSLIILQKILEHWQNARRLHFIITSQIHLQEVQEKKAQKCIFPTQAVIFHVN